MEKSIFEKMGETYRQEGDYLLPNLTTLESVPVCIWGRRRRRYPAGTPAVTLHRPASQPGRWTPTLQTLTDRLRKCFLS